VYTTSSVGNILTVQNTTANGYAGIQFISEPSVGNAGQAAINSFAPQTGDSILAFSTRQAATLTEKVRINASGDVGIGISSPGAKLDVRTSTSSTTDITPVAYFLARSTGSTTSTFGASINLYTENANANEYPISIAAINDSGGSALTNLGLYTYNSTQLIERFRIGSAGQFGIGGATYGTSGQVLTSGGADAAPTWANTSSSGTSIGLVRAIAINCILP
jgi:hypothetical protein